MNLVNWSPFRDLEDFFSGRRHGVFGALSDPEGGLVEGDFVWRPKADISESDTEYTVKAELPEVDKKDVEISLDNGMLTITGERRMEKKDESEKQHRIESFYGRFSRTFAVPDDVDEAKVSADSKNGVLYVHLPKSKTRAAEPKKISVQ